MQPNIFNIGRKVIIMKLKMNWYWGCIGFLGFLGILDPIFYVFFVFLLFFLEPVVRKPRK